MVGSCAPCSTPLQGCRRRTPSTSRSGRVRCISSKTAPSSSLWPEQKGRTMAAYLIDAAEPTSTRPIWCVTPQNWREVAEGLPAPALAYGEATGFKAEEGAVLVLPSAEGSIAGVLFGCDGNGGDPLAFGKLATSLPPGDYH